MNQTVPVTRIVPVIFACGICGLAYQADQGPFSHPARGQFDCTGCGTKVFQWSGHWDYTGWRSYKVPNHSKRIERPSPRRRKAKGPNGKGRDSFL